LWARAGRNTHFVYLNLFSIDALFPAMRFLDILALWYYQSILTKIKKQKNEE